MIIRSHQGNRPPTPRTITFICINYGCSTLVTKLISSIHRQGDPAIRYIVVDNTPRDPGLCVLSGNETISIIDAQKNRGFGGGCNLALNELEKIDPQGIAWLINPDAVLLPLAITKVRAYLEAPEAPAVLGTRICDSRGRLWFDHGRFDRSLGKINHEPSKGAHNEDDKISLASDIKRCQWVSGCSMVLDLSKIKQHPRFDERFFLYYEDVDLCLRLQRQGVEIFVTREILVSHSISATTSKQKIQKYSHATFSKLYLLQRHATSTAILVNLIRFYTKSLVQWIRDPHQAIGRTAGATRFLLWILRGED